MTANGRRITAFAFIPDGLIWIKLLEKYFVSGLMCVNTWMQRQ